MFKSALMYFIIIRFKLVMFQLFTHMYTRTYITMHKVLIYML